MKKIITAISIALLSVTTVTGPTLANAEPQSTSPNSSQVKNSSSHKLIKTESITQRNAKERARSYLRYQAFSRQGLIDQLRYEGFSLKDSKYAVDALKVNWNAQAQKKAASYLKSSSFSKSGLVDQLIYEGFTSAQANFGVRKTKVNWNTQAAKKAKSYLRSGSFSRQSLYDQLIYEGFTSSQANYGVNQTGL